MPRACSSGYDEDSEKGGSTIERNKPALSVIGVFLLVVAGIVACRGRVEAPAPTRAVPTRFPTATPLPPLPTTSPVGSAGNPLVILLVTPEAAGQSGELGELGDTLSEEAELSVEVRQTESYAEAYRALCRGEAQVVSLNAFAYLAASEEGCGEALYLLDQGDEPPVQGQLIGSAVYSIFSVEAFRGRTFCRADAFSVPGWILPALALRAHGIDPFSDLAGVVDAGSDDEVIRLIDQRECEVGATALGAEEDVRGLNDPEALLILEELPPVPDDVIVLSSQVDEFTQALLSDLLREHREELAGILGVEALSPFDEEAFSGLQTLIQAAGVDIPALAN
ncbi:MAG TPA: hypothetical protein ENI95_06485 [Chloroflexi bacterium]|nr:hypothetical protein [Chloroflexota bacterium]